MSIELKNVTYTYMPKTAFERTALAGVNLTLAEGKLTAIAGHTGSGKSTLVQHLNGLLHPTSGVVTVDGIDISKKTKEAIDARHSVGMVFQYPEHQLFEETVEKDVAFGPKNMGLADDEIKKRVKDALDFVKIDYETYKGRSPFQMSGGQMRRVAIAGVLAMKPKYLVLDEPTAGLDPRGRDDLMARIVSLKREKKMTIIIVSHNMDDIARIADEVVFMHDGNVLLDAPPKEAFFSDDAIAAAGLLPPHTVSLLKMMKDSGLDVDTDAFTVDEAVRRIAKAMKRREKSC
ncbi:MAG: energy-coupling factor transporter ATPase [Selenomonadaceae bacterium]